MARPGPPAARFAPASRDTTDAWTGGSRTWRELPRTRATRERGHSRYTSAVPTFNAARLRRSCWLAIFAMLALALLPAVSHALALARGDADRVEVCTPQGVRLVSDTDAGGRSDVPATLDVHLEHCPYCSSSGAALGMPPADTSVDLLPLRAVELPTRFLSAPRTPFAWRSAQPRAPPAHS